MYAAEHLAHEDVALGSIGDVLSRIRSGEAVSRSSIARGAGLAPSTASMRVDALVRLGLVDERGQEDSRGGRRAKRLEIAASAGAIAAIEVHIDRARLVLADLRGEQRWTERLDEVMSDDPAQFVEAIWAVIAAQAQALGLPLLGVAVGVPAPVTQPSGRVLTPSFRPTWHEADLPQLFARWTSVPVLVENDANLLAFAESTRSDDQLLAVKLGNRIGCGVIVGGRLHRGVSGAAGEVSHLPVDGEATIECACGIGHCLESVASGAAVVARLRAAGHLVVDARDLVASSRGADADVNEALRDAGTRIGTVLSSIVNFMNPREVILGGTLATSSTLVAAVRAELYVRCLPIVATDLEVRAVPPESRSVLRGAIRLALDEVLAPARVERLARAAENPMDAA